jgi:hypothetical protein
MQYAEGSGAQTDQFSNYKDVAGIKVAHMRNSGGGGRTTQLELKSVEIDPKIDMKLFAKPPPPAATPAKP